MTWRTGRPPLLLFPTPRKVRQVDGSVEIGEELWDALRSPAWVDARRVSHAGRGMVEVRVTGGACGTSEARRQAYRLAVGGNAGPRVIVEAATPAGARHGLATLRQLSRQFNTKLPVVEIEDEPAFATRGVMLDVSRCRIPTMEEFRCVIDQLAQLKCNHLQLYTEHTFAYAGHEEVWRGWSPITPAEMVTLDGWCREAGVELAANQNCFGHLHEWFKHERYAGLAETHGDWVFDVWPRTGPFSLCPTDPASLRLVEDLLSQLLPCVESSLVNIGCDETYDVGFGRSWGEVEQRGRATVYLEFVAKVAAAARRHGKRSMFWADIALSHPECVGQIPEDMIALAWGYEPDAPFERWCSQIRGAGREVWVCPGTSSWRSITGRTGERRGNIDAAARAGLTGGATGMLVCDWGDTGHWQTWPVAWHGIADGLHAAWCGPGAPNLDAEPTNDLGGERAAAWLEKLGEADASLRGVCLPLSRPGVEGRLRNQSAIFIDLFKGLGEQREVGAAGLWKDAVARLMDAALDLRLMEDDLNNRGFDELTQSLRMAEFAAKRGFLRRTGGDLRPLRGELDDLMIEHARLWRTVSREGGLAQSLKFFGGIDLGARGGG